MTWEPQHRARRGLTSPILSQGYGPRWHLEPVQLSFNLACRIDLEPHSTISEGLQKWVSGYGSERSDGTTDGIEYEWKIVDNPWNALELMPGGVDTPATLICTDTYLGISDTVSVGLPDA
eukprot:Protomagalhaensia_wolfi_Nauph_80__1699@NODE_2054_length_1230_cov_6_389589_g1320_i1_p2_GENE_NODE_2054_length_1230_cov_6_389589_g1320_i1NODE_2054_length_1230_cov_6_389589_g1320_i1_p2_ORF_typecomplete_len120_score12_71_NODE_2054_length_1230_cov_6_389589_g1320_i17561115